MLQRQDRLEPSLDSVGHNPASEGDTRAVQVRRAQKLEDLAQLAAGVAHDFNNTLTAILGNVELLRAALEPDAHENDPRLAYVEQIERATQRAAAMTRQMLAFGRRQTPRRELLDLNRVVSDIEPMLRQLAPPPVQFDIRPGREPVWLRADAGQLEQVLINLVLNARDAMPRGGVIAIAASRVDLDEDGTAAHPDARTGPHALLTVSDTGCGMDAATLERMFEPFFTTKPSGQGTGLGLASVYGIVKQAAGHVTVDSQPGRGTTFRVFLPAAAGGQRPGAARAGEPHRLTGSETILVCDSADDTRDLLVSYLRSAGYTVLAARLGADAARLVTERGVPLHLLLTGPHIADASSAQLAELLRQSRPNLRALPLCPAPSDATRARPADDQPDPDGYLSRRALLQRVRVALDGRAS